MFMPSDFIARTYDVVVFDTELFFAGFTQLHEWRSLGCNIVTPAESGPLSNATTPCV